MKSDKTSAGSTARRTAVAMAVATALATPAVAQDVIEEIVVTATKRESSVQDLAVAVTAFSGEMINELQLTNVIDIDKMVPGLKVRYVGADPTIIMRGAGAAGTNDIATLHEPEHKLTVIGLTRVGLLQNNIGSSITVVIPAADNAPQVSIEAI